MMTKDFEDERARLRLEQQEERQRYEQEALNAKALFQAREAQIQAQLETSLHLKELDSSSIRELEQKARRAEEQLVQAQQAKEQSIQEAALARRRSDELFQQVEQLRSERKENVDQLAVLTNRFENTSRQTAVI